MSVEYSPSPDVPEVDDAAAATPAGPLRGLLPSLVLNGAVPFLIYEVLAARHASTVRALTVAAIVPAVVTVVGLARSRRADLLGVLSLIFIALGLLGTLISGNARFLLVKESFLTGVFGVLLLGSLLLPRPLMFFFGRQFATGGIPARVAWWNGLWQYPSFRSGMRRMTVTWGVALLAEALVRFGLVFVLPISVFLIASPLLAYGVIAGLIAWTMRYSRRMQRRGEAAQAAQA